MKVICLIILLVTLFGKWNAPPGIKGYIENRTDWKVEVTISNETSEKQVTVSPFWTQKVYLLPGKYRIKLIAYRKEKSFKACEWVLIVRESDYLIDRNEKSWDFVIVDWVFEMPGNKIELGVIQE